MQVRTFDINCGFIDGYPVADILPKILRNECDIALEQTNIVPTHPASFSGEPCRIGEVVKREHRLHTALPQCPNDIAIMGDRLLIPFRLPRLDPAPLD